MDWVNRQPLIGGEPEMLAIFQHLRRNACCRFIGPPYHHKTKIMHEVCRRAEARLGIIGLYVSLRRISAETELDFFALLHHTLVTEAARDHQLRVRRDPIRSINDFKLRLLELPRQREKTVAIFVDDLDRAPQFVTALVKALGGASKTSAAGKRLLAVVCASESLKRMTASDASPFELFSPLVRLTDLSLAETAELVAAQLQPYAIQTEPSAVKFLFEQTQGDRLLVMQVGLECYKQLGDAGGLVTQERIADAIRALVAAGGWGAVTEGLFQIERDPHSLDAVVKLVKDGIASRAGAADPSAFPDPLTVSGFVREQGGQFVVKSPLHKALLEHHFSLEHLGEIYFARGDWERALLFWQADLRAGADDETARKKRARIFFAGVSSIYSETTRRDAYAWFDKCLRAAYPHAAWRVYETQGEYLNRVLPRPHRGDEYFRRFRRDIDAHPELRVLDLPNDSLIQMENVYVRLRADRENLGLVVFENLLTGDLYGRHHEVVLELESHLGHVARALRVVRDLEESNQRRHRRAANWQQLLKLERDLMRAERRYERLLQVALASALKALAPRAQRGSIYTFDPSLKRLVMTASAGYSEEVQRALQFRRGEGLAGHVFKTGVLYNAADAQRDPHFQLPTTGNHPIVRAALGVPLIGRKGIVGVLCLDNLDRPDAFDDESEQVAALFAGQVAPWLESVRLLEKLREQQQWSQLTQQAFHEMDRRLYYADEILNELAVAAREGTLASNAPAEILRLDAFIAHVRPHLPVLSAYMRINRLELHPLDLRAEVESQAHALEALVPTRLRFVVVSGEAGELRVRADSGFLKILLTNLIENAVEAMEHLDAGEIRVELQRRGRRAVLRVHNDGDAVPEKLRRVIFRPGFSTKSTRKKGRGYGLRFCRRIALAHHGTLNYDESDLRPGASFVLKLPLNREGALRRGSHDE